LERDTLGADGAHGSGGGARVRGVLGGRSEAAWRRVARSRARPQASWAAPRARGGVRAAGIRAGAVARPRDRGPGPAALGRAAPAGERLRLPTLAARYVVLGNADEIVTAGVSEQLEGQRLIVDLKGRLKPGAYRVALTLALDENYVHPQVKVIPYRVLD